jgi:hypothetical protein
MDMWQRLLITFLAMLAVSILVSVFWNAVFAFPLPAYVSGVVGGFTAVPVWELLKRVDPAD